MADECKKCKPGVWLYCEKCGRVVWPKKMRPCCLLAQRDYMSASGMLAFGNEISPSWARNQATQDMALAHVRYCAARNAK